MVADFAHAEANAQMSSRIQSELKGINEILQSICVEQQHRSATPQTCYNHRRAYDCLLRKLLRFGKPNARRA
jgi:hypothetical protein